MSDTWSLPRSGFRSKDRSSVAFLHTLLLLGADFAVSGGVPREAMAEGETTHPHHRWCRSWGWNSTASESSASKPGAVSLPPFSAPSATVLGDVKRHELLDR